MVKEAKGGKRNETLPCRKHPPDKDLVDDEGKANSEGVVRYEVKDEEESTEAD
jgi:hypothetical protein